MKKGLLGLLASVSILIGITGNVSAEVPETISYQGYLTDSSDIAVQGVQDVTFKLYDIEGTEIWTETHQLTVTNGVFEAILGSQQVLPVDLQQGASLGVTFGTNAEMTPRQTLNSTPFAIHAKTTEKDTLNSLTCTVNQVPKWSGSQWDCSDDELGQNTGVEAITTGAGLSSTGTETVNISLDPAGVTSTHIANGQVIKGLSVNGIVLKDNVTLNAGSQVSISESGNIVTISSDASGPSSIITNNGLTGGGNSGVVTLGIEAGGIQASMIDEKEVVKGIIVGGSLLRDNVRLEAGSGVNLVPTSGTVTINATPASNTVTTDTAQTISGSKTFTEESNFNNNISLKTDAANAFQFHKADGSAIGEIGFETSVDGVNNWFFDLRTAADRILFDNDVYIGRPRSGTYWSGSGQLTVVGEINSYNDLKFYRRNNAPQEPVTYVGKIFGNGNSIQLQLDDTQGAVKITGNLEVTGVASKTGGGTWNALSDSRLKNNVIPMNPISALTKLTSLNPVRYQWINPEEHGNKVSEYGFIAQELEKVFPSWVTETDASGNDVGLVAEKAKAIAFPHEFNAYVVSALQELKNQNETLKAIVCEDHPEKELCQ